MTLRTRLARSHATVGTIARTLLLRHVPSLGLSFHKYFFDLGRKAATSAAAPPKQNTIASPHVRMLGDNAAVISYVRVIQSGGDLATCQETRVWQRGPDRKWKNVHFHRSSNL